MPSGILKDMVTGVDLSYNKLAENSKKLQAHLDNLIAHNQSTTSSSDVEESSDDNTTDESSDEDQAPQPLNEDEDTQKPENTEKTGSSRKSSDDQTSEVAIIGDDQPVQASSIQHEHSDDKSEAKSQIFANVEQDNIQQQQPSTEQFERRQKNNEHKMLEVMPSFGEGDDTTSASSNANRVTLKKKDDMTPKNNCQQIMCKRNCCMSYGSCFRQFINCLLETHSKSKMTWTFAKTLAFVLTNIVIDCIICCDCCRYLKPIKDLVVNSPGGCKLLYGIVLLSTYAMFQSWNPATLDVQDDEETLTSLTTGNSEESQEKNRNKLGEEMLTDCWSIHEKKVGTLYINEHGLKQKVIERKVRHLTLSLDFTKAPTKICAAIEPQEDQIEQTKRCLPQGLEQWSQKHKCALIYFGLASYVVFLGMLVSFFLPQETKNRLNSSFSRFHEIQSS